ncbi:MAG: hypothetical protein A2W07_06260 [candidate division Zixibacteria bacterium RBG_16_43_9]|nr:MAG: hypothetical protein A2W07_06260 [candidate division Zixibacteria bacterium RBG_16_43_9]
MEAAEKNFTSPGQVLKWIDHPLKKSRKNLLIVVLFLILAPTVVFFSTKSIFFLFLSIIFLLGSLSTFFLPTTYELSEDSLKVKFFFNTRKMEWGKYRSFYVDKNGVLLSPFEKPSRLENFRGIYLRFNQNKDEVVNFIKQRIKS